MTEPESMSSEVSAREKRNRRRGLLLLLVVLGGLGWGIFRIVTWDPNYVTVVDDANRLNIKSTEGVLLIGIEVLPVKRPQDFKGIWLGEVATDFTTERVLDKHVRIEQDKVPNDPAGWILAYIFYEEDGTEHFLNEELVRHGLALAHPVGENLKYRAQLDAAQKAAREAKVGLWDPLYEEQFKILRDSL